MNNLKKLKIKDLIKIYIEQSDLYLCNGIINAIYKNKRGTIYGYTVFILDKLKFMYFSIDHYIVKI